MDSVLHSDRMDHHILRQCRLLPVAHCSIDSVFHTAYSSAIMVSAKLFSLPAAVSAASLLLSAVVVDAHGWIDCLDTDRTVVYDKAGSWIYAGTGGNGLCKGYINDYPGRGDSKINDKMTYQLNVVDVFKGAPLCAAGPIDYSGWRHRIRVATGEKIYFAYTDNGHTASDNSGKDSTYGLYWTGVPTTKLTQTTELSDAKLIDGKIHRYDDGNCGPKKEGRAGEGFPCVGELVMPASAKPGIYNLVWFWMYYNGNVTGTPDTGLRGSAYTSCFQVEVTGSGGTASDEEDDDEDEEMTLPPKNEDSEISRSPVTSGPATTGTPKPTLAPKPDSAGDVSPSPTTKTPTPTEKRVPTTTKPVAKPEPKPSKPTQTPAAKPTQTPPPATPTPDVAGDASRAPTATPSKKSGCKVQRY